MDEELKKLRSELSQIKKEFGERVDYMETRIAALEDSPEDNFDNVPTSHKSSDLITNEQFEAQVSPPEVACEIPASVSRTSSRSKQPTSPPWLWVVISKSILALLFEWFSPVANIYQSYKQKGMLGIFILTVTGIGLTLAGFGFLMQMLIVQMGSGSKALLMCVAAVAVMVLGVGLKIKTQLSEFATAIVTLGILLSYSTVYFSGNVHEIIPLPMVLIAYLAIAMLCHFIAHWLDTHIVAALGVIGIATMPLISNSVEVNALYYLISLAFVSFSSLILAYKRVGQWLANLTLAFCVVSIEWLLNVQQSHISVWTIEIFYLLFFGYILMSMLRNENQLKSEFVFLAATIGSTVLLVFQTTDFFVFTASLSFLVNASLAIIVSVVFYRIKRELVPLMVLVSAMWAALTILSFLSKSYWGIAWAAEGILLLLIGRQYLLAAVVNQGQVLLSAALVFAWIALGKYFPLPALQSLDGWILSLFILFAVTLWQNAINGSQVFNAFSQAKIKPALQFIQATWISVLLIAIGDIWIGMWTGAFIIFVQFALLLRARQISSTSIEVLAAVLILVPLYYVYKGAIEVGSLRFSLLPLFAKVSAISAFIQLWLWAEFYRKLQPESALSELAENARILFYMLLPICWISTVYRRFGIDASAILWLSPLVSLLLARKFKHIALELEAKLLAIAASIGMLVSMGSISFMPAIGLIAGFIGLYSLAYIGYRRDPDPLLKFICGLGLFSMGFAVPYFIAETTSSMLFGMVALGLYWAFALAFTSDSKILMQHERRIAVMNLLILFASWALIFLSVWYAMVPSLIILSVLLQKSKLAKTTESNSELRYIGHLHLHGFSAITYVLVLLNLNELSLDLLIAPALAVHGAAILFLNDKRIATLRFSFGLILLGIVKLAFGDAANALLWQKVIMFMGIGVFILFASFWYQKLVSRTLKDEVNTNPAD